MLESVYSNFMAGNFEVFYCCVKGERGVGEKKKIKNINKQTYRKEESKNNEISSWPSPVMTNSNLSLKFCFLVPESVKFAYEPTKQYEYTYENDIQTSIPGSTEEQSSLHMRATVQIEVLSPCEFNLKVSTDLCFLLNFFFTLFKRFCPRESCFKLIATILWIVDAIWMFWRLEHDNSANAEFTVRILNALGSVAYSMMICIYFHSIWVLVSSYRGVLFFSSNHMRR